MSRTTPLAEFLAEKLNARRVHPVEIEQDVALVEWFLAELNQAGYVIVPVDSKQVPTP